MDYKNVEKRLLAASTILDSDSLDSTAFSSLKTLLHGIHPRLDATLKSAEKAANQIDMFQKGDAVGLTAEAIPAHTPQEKKRKKYILLFLKFWRDLKSEVARVEKEFKEGGKSHSAQNLAWAKIFAAAKGPLGIITVVAVGIVMLKATEVSVIIKNINCDPIEPATKFTLNLPGLSLPQVTIPAGGEAVAKIAPITMNVDATSGSAVHLSLYGVKQTIAMDSSDIRVTFDGQLLNGKVTTIELGKSKTHVAEIRCP